MLNHEKHRMAFGKSRYATYNVKNERNDGCSITIFNVIGKKNNQTPVSDVNREIPKPRFRHYPLTLGLGFLGLHRRTMTDSISLNRTRLHAETRLQRYRR